MACFTDNTNLYNITNFNNSLSNLEMTNQYYPTVSPITSLWVPGSVDPATLNMAQNYGYSQQLCFCQQCSEVQASNFPLHYWGGNQGQTNVDTFHQNIHAKLQFGAGPARVELKQAKRSHPYGTNRSRVGERGGPSTSSPSRVPSVGPPAGSTVEAGKERRRVQSTKPTCSNAPSEEAKPRRCRIETKKGAARLAQWVQRREGTPYPPAFNKSLKVAVEIIPTIRQVVYQEHHLFVIEADEGKPRSKHAKKERERRNTVRGMFQELSRYYPRVKGLWRRHELLSEVMQDLETHPDLQSTPREPTPELLTSETASLES